MSKLVILITILLAVCVGAWLVGKTRMTQPKEQMTQPKEEKHTKTRIVLYNVGGKTIQLDNQSPFFKDVLHESTKLFLESDSSYRLIMNSSRIKAVREQERSLEIEFPEIQEGEVLNGHKVHYTKLLVPLSGQFADGTVFFAGSWDRLLQTREPTYSSLEEYGPTNYVRNTHGLNPLKESLQKMSIIIN